MEVYGNSLTRFLIKCYDMVDDSATDSVVSWSPTNESFIVWNQSAFSQDLLPNYFKHNNFSSFVRQLNQYGFKKVVNSDCLEFANDGFRKGQKHMLKTISRRKPTTSNIQQKQPQGKITPVGACVEVGKFGIEEEIEQLKRDKNVLMQELVKLRLHQQSTEPQLLALRQRLEGMEKHQQQMVSFFAMAMQTPGFLGQLLQQNDNRRLVELNKKRRLPALELSAEGEHELATSNAQIVTYVPPTNETLKPTLLVPISNTGIPLGLDPSTNGENDSFINVNGTSLGMDTSSPMEISSESDDALIFPDIPDDLLEQLLSTTALLENSEENETYLPEAMDTGMWVE
ncbi:heat stress transcription factor A-1-like [Tasmannia lanceolata]|uniref:heat stress transcription factor A-1-like n=1 Tax=Tasmannia lanceolata TaxID=3420 RepID=UPI00406342F2